MSNRFISIAFAVSACATTALAQNTTYTWSGSVDDDWTNTANWDANGVPVDSNAATDPGDLDMHSTDLIVMDLTTNVPGTNVPAFDGDHNAADDGSDSSPAVQFLGNGAWTVPQGEIWTNLPNGNSRYIWTVGSGATITKSGGIQLNRHGDGEHRFLIEGALIFSGNVDMSYRAHDSNSRNTVFEMNGGTVTVNGQIFDGGLYKYFEFLTVGSSVTAQYGGNFTDFAAVEANVGPTGAFRSFDPFTIGVEAVDNLDGTFTVTSVAPPAPNYWTGNGSAILGDASSNFTLNAAADPLVEGTMADVIAIPATKVFFDDVYSFSGGTAAVNTATLSTVAGGVVIDDLDFYNTIAYSLSSPDANGVAGATNINLLGSGQLTLTGIHSTTGVTTVGAGNTLVLTDTTDVVLPNGTIANTGTVVIDVDVDTTQDGSLIGGSGVLEKQGTGDLTLLTGNSGTLNVTEGEVSITDAYSNGTINIAAGATFEANITVFYSAPHTIFSGNGTLLKTGAEQIRWAGQVGTFALGSGALIDVQEGTFRGGSNANENWTANLSDLNVAAGATFNTHEANVVVDAITGAGTIGSGYNGAGYVNFTIGVDNGSGTFTGSIVDQDANMPCNIVKQGTGTQVFDGDNTYKGNTTIEGGVLTLGSNSHMYFYPQGSGVTNAISGSAGTVNLQGVITIDTASAVAAPGSAWALVDTSGGITANYDSGFSVQTASAAVWDEDTPGVWTLVEGIGTYTFAEATGTLTFDVAAGSNLWTGSISGTWDQATTANFSDNAPGDALNSVVYDGLSSVLFTDEYYSSGSAIPVTNSTVTIAAGGVGNSGGTVTFANITVPYIIESSDEFGIIGDTAIDVNGNITLRGTHTTTGATTVGGGVALTFDAPVAASFVSPIGGDGDIDKTGVDTMTLSSANTYTGSTSVSVGTLKVTANSATTSVNIASGATFELDYNNRWGQLDATISGAGTFKKSGTATADFYKATIALDSGSLIDVAEGTLTGSSGGTGGSENWTGNMSSMSIAAGATFKGVEGNIRLDALSGLGTFSTGWEGYIGVTLGVDNGGDDFGGVIEDNNRTLLQVGNIIKTGTGTQTLSGYNTYTGNTVIEGGALNVAATGALSFAPEANGVINTVSGVDLSTCSMALEGTVDFNFIDADITFGNSWVIIDDTNLTFSYGAGLLSVNSSDGVFTETAAGVWELDANGNLWTYHELTYTLTLEQGSGETNEELSAREFTENFVVSIDGANYTAGSTFSAFVGFTYELYVTDDLTADFSTWYKTDSFVVTELTLPENGMITLSETDLLATYPQSFYIMVIYETPPPAE